MAHHHCHNHHSHDHGPSENDLGPQDSLYAYIDRQNVLALNIPGEHRSSSIIKPWQQRGDDNVYIESEVDDQIIIRVPFTGSVRLRTILLKTGPADYTPSKVFLYANNMNLDFNDVADEIPTQELGIVQTQEVGEYAVKTAKFSNISSISLYFPSSQGADNVRIYYLGFLGHWSERKERPVITVYEAQPNISDHEKIQGTDGNFSTPQM